MARRLEDLVLRGRWLVLAVVVVTTVLAAAAYSSLRIENTIDAWFSASDPGYQRYKRFRERFETEETFFVVVRAPDVFAADALARIDRITSTLAAQPQVTRVVSLTSIEDIRGTATGIVVEPLVPSPDGSGLDGGALRHRVLSDPFFPGRIVSRDGRTTVVMAEVGRSSAAGDAAVVDTAEAVMAANAAPGFAYHLAGWLAVNVHMNRLTERDVERGFPISMLVLTVCLAVFLRSVRGVLIVNLAVVLAILWTMGTFAAMGYVGTAITVSALPGMLLALAVATAVHVVMRFQESRVETSDPLAAMRATLPAVAAPVLLTSATTALGFDSLSIAFLEPVKQLGLFASLGMVYTCVICLTVVPIILVAFPPRREPHLNPWLERPLLAIADFNALHFRGILAACAALAAVGGLGLAQLRPQGTNLNYLPADSAPVRAMHFIEDHFGGAGTIDVLVSGPPDVVKEPAVAAAVADVQETLASYPYVTSTIAYTDLLRRMNQALNDGDPAHHRLPTTTAGIAQELLLYETSGGADLPTLVDVSSYDVARVRGFTSSFMDMDENERFFNDLKARLRALVPRGATPLAIEVAGDWPLWLRMNLSLMDTMRDSFALTFAGVTIMMIWLTRSVRLGLLTMIPNVLPVLLAIGTLGWMGVELDFATVMIAGIALGIAVDDTIHYLSRLREELAVAGDPGEAMRRAHATVGQAMVTTGIVLCLGMGSMVTSSFPPHRTFAVVIALTMGAAMLGDLLLLPALLHATGLVPRARGRGNRGQRPRSSTGGLAATTVAAALGPPAS
jgi:hypothetical protein